MRYYSGNFAVSASVPDPPGGMKLAANAKALMGTFVPSGAMLCTDDLCRVCGTNGGNKATWRGAEVMHDHRANPGPGGRA